MPPVDPNAFTGRCIVDYTTGDDPTSRTHSFMWRYNPSLSDPADLGGATLQLLQALGANNLRQGWRVVRLRLSPINDPNSYPIPLGSGLSSFVGTATSPYTPRVEAVETRFVGRSFVTGRKVGLSIFRAVADAEASFRIEAGTSGFAQAVANVVAFLNSQAAQFARFITIDGTAPTWYSYANEQYNSYWERRARI